MNDSTPYALHDIPISIDATSQRRETESMSGIDVPADIQAHRLPGSKGRRLRSLRFATQRQERLAAGLTKIAGFLDAYGIITYNTDLSFMSGNTTQAGYRTGQGDFGAVVPSALAIVFFVGGSFSGALLAHSAVRRIRRLIFGVIAASLTLIIGFTLLGRGFSNRRSRMNCALE